MMKDGIDFKRVTHLEKQVHPSIAKYVASNPYESYVDLEDSASIVIDQFVRVDGEFYIESDRTNVEYESGKQDMSLDKVCEAIQVTVLEKRGPSHDFKPFKYRRCIVYEFGKLKIFTRFPNSQEKFDIDL